MAPDMTKSSVLLSVILVLYPWIAAIVHSILLNLFLLLAGVLLVLIALTHAFRPQSLAPHITRRVLRRITTTLTRSIAWPPPAIRPGTAFQRPAVRLLFSISIPIALVGIYLPYWWAVQQIRRESQLNTVIMAAGSLYCLLRLLTERNNERQYYTSLTCLTIVAYLGFFPQLAYGALNGGMLALAGFYTALFTWFFDLASRSMDMRPMSVPKRLSDQQAKMFSDYYMGLMKIVVLIFSGITITMTWQLASGLWTRETTLGGRKEFYLCYVFGHDIFGTGWMFIGVGGIVLANYFEIARRCVSPPRGRSTKSCQPSQRERLVNGLRIRYEHND